MKEEENNAGKKRKKVDGDDSDGDNGYKNSDNNTLKSDEKKILVSFCWLLKTVVLGATSVYVQQQRAAAYMLPTAPRRPEASYQLFMK